MATYLADVVAVAGVALLVPDVLALLAGSGPRASVGADLALLVTGLAGHILSRTGVGEAAALALASPVTGALAVVWLTGRWWVSAAVGAAVAASAPHILGRRRAAAWGVAGSLLGLTGLAASAPTALVAAAAVAAVSVLSLRLSAGLRSAAARGVVELEQALEVERLRAAEILARLNRYEGRSHAGARRSVLRTVLTRRLSVVQAVAQTVARDLRRALTPGRHEDLLGAARRSADRAEQLGRLAAGGEARERETTLALVWPRVLDHLGSDVGEEHHLEVGLSDALPPVAGGTEEWSQILAALVQNALEAMPRGGVVTVTADGSDRPGFARVVVRDNGPGIPAELLPRVLEPFYTSRAEQGAEGLGLATVASLVEALDGDMHITSAPGAGTAVEIEVPFYAAAVRPAAPEPMRLEGTVLVADDDKEFRRSLVRLLESFGLGTLDVDSGTVALAHLHARPDRFRMAILDIVMPGTPVSELVMDVRETRPGFPFLLVSGLATARLVDSLLALGGIRFLKKPFTREELFYTLRDLSTVGAAEPTPATPS